MGCRVLYGLNRFLVFAVLTLSVLEDGFSFRMRVHSASLTSFVIGSLTDLTLVLSRVGTKLVPLFISL